MNKVLLIAVIALLVLVFLSPLIVVSFQALLISAGTGDWSYELPNDYAIWRVNSKTIEIGIAYGEDKTGLTLNRDPYGDDPYRQKEELIGIPSYVKSFWHNDRYVCAITIAQEDYDDYQDGKEVAIQYNTIDTLARMVHGPYDEEKTFLQQLNELGISDDIVWRSTVPRPDGAT